ncbi:F-box only protein 5 [Oryzias melastigma]|uniref:F-box only protein 43 n=1 Tax=Oryzias melastigma TaxID=30732 RepID=A0A834C539_ORYME|nr:F-box only protein 5 [Oryzias melastigma]
MKCPQYESAGMENTADSKVSHLKASVLKQQTPVKAPLPAVFSSSAVHNKENSTNRDHDRVLEECFEDSGYLSLQNSHSEPHGDEEDPGFLGKLASPSKCKGEHQFKHPLSLAVSTPKDHFKRTALSSTPASDRRGPNLPILKFQEAMCEELSKTFKKNKKFDWSIMSKLADGHLLDRVIGRQMGLEHVDVFASLLSRNMKIILTNILALLGDMDLISCKKVSRTWRKIICEDAAANTRCQEAEDKLWESTNSLNLKACGLTRDVATSRVVLSCMQTLATSNTQSSASSLSGQSCRTSRTAAISQKCGVPKTLRTRFSEYVQAAGALKNHESLRQCRRCGSPAKHLSELHRATCTRSSCQYDFCTRCQETYHGSTPCRTVQPRSRSTPVLTGSSRDKRSIRRL